ncbi:MAG TPA: hypothetical protein VMJ74_12370 [Pseudomonadales bacterium]|nr:hypothetical protein [Pseudomonadales bacterium]
MPHVPETADIAAWHRYFAVDCNNRAWDLSVAARSAEADDEMLNVAHAAAFHWHYAGNELNHMRATMLLAEVHALRGLGSTALGYATRMRDYFLGRTTPDWELAFTHAVFAHAAYAAGERESHRRSYDEAVRAVAAIADPKEREIVEQTFVHVPRPT